jgi:hypothetical protein
MTASSSGSTAASARPDATPPPRRSVWRRALWIALAVFCLASITLTQMIDRYAPGNPVEAQAMGDQLEQRFGEGSVLRLEATMKDRVRAIWSDELPATATVHVSGEPADPANQEIYSCLYVRDDGGWRLTDVTLVVGSPSPTP